MKRLSWDVVFALLVGFGLGLVYAWAVSPRGNTDTQPSLLRADFKNQFREVISAAYASTGNLPRAQARLALLGDLDPISALNAQAQQSTANGQFATGEKLAALAFALQNGNPAPVINTPPAGQTSAAPNSGTPTLFPSPVQIPFETTITPLPDTNETSPPPVINTLAPRPTRTASPTPGASFRLTSSDVVCDPTLPEGLLQVIVLNANRRQLAGIKINISWDSGNENFFTGLKPELGNGYADYQMTPGVLYAVQLTAGSDTAIDLIAPDCQTSDGEAFTGGLKLTFQQP